jgi:prepilin-type N-terminal cleavage/methylation domain-containing protein
MKILVARSNRNDQLGAKAGFTLTEMLVASTVFLLVVGGLIASNLFGLQMFLLSQTKLQVTQWSRETVMQLRDEIHVCNNAQVGTVSNGMFVAFLDGETQQGNGLLINTTTNTNSFIIYFVNPADQTFRRTTDQPGSAEILASSVTNTLPFSAEDFFGNVLTNTSNSQVIHLLLEFHQPGLFLQNADYYKLETSVKQRVVP